MKRARTYDPARRLEGEWLVTIKLDGVRALWKDGRWFSRAGKPLFNIPPPPDGISDVEVFHGSWNDTVSRVRTRDGDPIGSECLYSLDPIDQRLVIGRVTSPSEEEVDDLLAVSLAAGHEGIVLRRDEDWVKVKPVVTEEATVTGLVEGKGKYVGKLGAIETDLGRVGIGFSDADRVRLFDRSVIGSVIEVAFTEKTESGKFRFPRFVRERFDRKPGDR